MPFWFLYYKLNIIGNLYSLAALISMLFHVNDLYSLAALIPMLFHVNDLDLFSNDHILFTRCFPFSFQLRKAYFKQLEEITSLKEQISLKDKRIRQLEEEISMLKIPVTRDDVGPDHSDCWSANSQVPNVLVLVLALTIPASPNVGVHFLDQ